MKTIVIYKSKTGFVKKYAGWISKELSADISEASKVSGKMLMNYDTIVFGGSLHAVGIIGIDIIKKNFEAIKDKKLVIYACGASLPGQKVTDHVLSSNFSEEQLKKIRFFYLRGGFDYDKLPLYDKLLMALLRKKIEKKQKKGEQLARDEKGMLELFGKPADYTSKENINELVSYVRS